MKTRYKNISIPQEEIDDLMRQFSEDEERFARLSSPLVNAGVTHHEDGLFEN